MRETAYAKINLALHVRRRREDGYHEIETLFAFVDAGDVLEVTQAQDDWFICFGEFAEQVEPFANIVPLALSKLPRKAGISIALEKNLPVAAGLGGGSADAGAVFRIVEALHGLPSDWRARAASLGADVPACVESRTAIGRGTGTELAPGPGDLAGTPLLLVNPRVPLSTAPVFKGWDGVDRGELPGGTAREIALAGRNDLEAPAMALCPAIGEVLHELRATTAAWIVRLTGSGATCFALFDTQEQRDDAATSLRQSRPEWWQMSGWLR